MARTSPGVLNATHATAASGTAMTAADDPGTAKADSVPAVSETPVAPDLGTAETERIRTRVRLMVEITARAGRYRKGLAKAAGRLRPEEAAIIADLEHHGLDVVQLREVLCGAHVLIDEPTLYDRWRFPQLSRERLSSHHRTVDKQRYPDLGLRGPLVREKLHGRTAQGTWVQLEKTPASMGGFKLPTWNDLQHLVDYVVYRITKRNVGPWGLSGHVEKRPMYLSPDLGARVPLPAASSDELTGAVSRLEEDDDTTSASPELAARFPPPDRANDLAELVFTPGTTTGRGLFGSSDVWITETPSQAARALLGEHPPQRWAAPDPGATRAATTKVGDGRELRYAVRLRPPAGSGSGGPG